MLAVVMLQFAIGYTFRSGFKALQMPEMARELLQEIVEEPTARLFSCRAVCQKHAGDQLHILLRKLCYSQFPKVLGLAGLPSWVPDWPSNLRPSFYTVNERCQTEWPLRQKGMITPLAVPSPSRFLSLLTFGGVTGAYKFRPDNHATNEIRIY
ncbi:hypothetical protein EDB81DRAFT_814610 [Dactylonectria macrodidyma]|uniref:Uncharacterized protein n=1 Tax=Dactylonectria macrodidyma TaxID=307937 RepID=A0A9P9IIN8_9HYPO|nr:hypothetical protein EDB81DRAFT_814610 [Dactylonectria macrodidyma]